MTFKRTTPITALDLDPSDLQVATFRPGTVVPFGDSTNVVPGAGVTWPDLFSMMSDGQFRMPYNAGISGNTTAQMLARITTDVIAYAPAYCVVLGGTNDVAQSVPFATTKANLTAIYTVLINAGIRPVLGTVTPRNITTAEQVALRQLNAWIRGYANKYGYPLIDFNAVLTDPLTELWASGLNADNVHPSASGATAMAQAAWQVFGSAELTNPITPSLVPLAWSETTYAAGYGDNTVLVLNPLFADSNANNIPDRWTLQTTAGATYPGAVTASVISDSRFLGKALRWQSNALNGFCSLKQVVPQAGWSVGDSLRLVYVDGSDTLVQTAEVEVVHEEARLVFGLNAAPDRTRHSVTVRRDNDAGPDVIHVQMSGVYEGVIDEISGRSP
jgi:lysophospholipase L1-like esterase